MCISLLQITCSDPASGGVVQLLGRENRSKSDCSMLKDLFQTLRFEEFLLIKTGEKKFLGEYLKRSFCYQKLISY